MNSHPEEEDGPFGTSEEVALDFAKWFASSCAPGLVLTEKDIEELLNWWKKLRTEQALMLLLSQGEIKIIEWLGPDEGPRYKTIDNIEENPTENL